MTTVAGLCEIVKGIGVATAGVTPSPTRSPREQVPSGGVFIECYPVRGEFAEVTRGRLKGEHTLHLMAATPLKHMRTDWERVIGLGDTLSAALLAADLPDVLTQTVRYTCGELEFGGQELFGWLFEIDVTTRGALSAEEG